MLDKRVELEPLIAGGGHERGLRSGTENVAAIVGFGVACELATSRLGEVTSKLPGLRDRLGRKLVAMGATLFGAEALRLPNTVYFSVPGIEGETLVAQLDRAGFAVASGAGLFQRQSRAFACVAGDGCCAATGAQFGADQSRAGQHGTTD